MKYHYVDENVKIRISFPKRVTKLIANAYVTLETSYFGVVTVKNFQIWPSNNFNDRLQEAINITPYTIRNGSFSTMILFFESQAKWIELEGLIYSALKTAQQEKKKKSSPENIDPNDIPL